ncbi:LOW QUALITY PROTEIN: uridine-cytidine kinase-like 1, partial [Egretta garzetta]|uniref:LOW QUALITY PROTEIN: uridine-cytidine kinase-like 1 n=1 Tax=Egretta garzetta TaxID=188379 RepID=UPI00163B97BA
MTARQPPLQDRPLPTGRPPPPPPRLSRQSISGSDWLNTVAAGDITGELVAAGLPDLAVNPLNVKRSSDRRFKTVYGANVIVFEGILAFANKELLKVSLPDAAGGPSWCVAREGARGSVQRWAGRDIVGVIKQYNKFVKPAFEQYIEPTVQVADIVVPRGGENFVALDLIVQHVHSQLEKREITVRAALASAHQGQPLPKTLSVLENTPQVRGMHTIIRNKDTTRDEFIFYSKRLMRLLIEHALSFLPLKSVTVETPQGTMYEGKRFHRERVTGAAPPRRGETMEQALTAVCKDIRLGKILIQTNHDTGEPELHYLRLPKEISEDYVILMDSTVSITDMSKVSMSSRPEPGYENMDHFSINVDYVAEMLRTIEFQTEPLGEDEADGPGDSSEAAVDEDRLDSLEVPDATE